MNLRKTPARTAARYGTGKSNPTSKSKKAENCQHSTQSGDDDFTFKDIGPFSPLNSETGLDDGNATRPNKIIQKKMTVRAKQYIKRDKLKPSNLIEMDDISIDSPALKWVIDDKNIDDVKAVLENLPDHFAKEYRWYLFSLPQKSSLTSVKEPPKPRKILWGNIEVVECRNCIFCDQKFVSTLELSKHLNFQHGGSKGFKCTSCNKMYKPFSSFFEHVIAVHSGWHQCRYCNLKFPNRDQLKEHVNLAHSGTLKFVCTLCQKVFRTELLLMLHINIHTGLAPYKCPECPKAYSSGDSLAEHARLHSRDKYQFKCNKCFKIFVSQKLLNHHALTHGSERKFKCNLCDKAFKIPENLVHHRRSHNKDRKFSCGICVKSYLGKSRLKRHIAEKHPTLDETLNPEEVAKPPMRLVDRSLNGFDDRSLDQFEGAKLQINKQTLHLDRSLILDFMETDSDDTECELG